MTPGESNDFPVIFPCRPGTQTHPELSLHCLQREGDQGGQRLGRGAAQKHLGHGQRNSRSQPLWTDGGIMCFNDSQICIVKYQIAEEKNMKTKL